MDNNSTRGQSKVAQFREISDVDKAIVNRLVQDRTARKAGDMRNIDIAPIAHVFKRTLREASDIRNIFQIMPDLHLPRAILVSAIVSPGDLARTDLLLSNTLKGVESALIATLTNALKEFFIDEQKLQTKVPEWVDDALIWSGAHPILILPEASIDRIITGGVDTASMESVASYGGEWINGWYRPKGIFGLRIPTAESENYVSFESTRDRLSGRNMAEYHTIKASKGRESVELPFRVTDNLAALRTPAVQQLKRGKAMERAYGTPALESRRRQRQADKSSKSGSSISNTAVYANFFRKPQSTKRSRLEIIPTTKQAGGNNLGHPLVYHLQTEAVMPICVPGDESNHVGYLLLLDANGFPISHSKKLNYYDDVRRSGSTDTTGSSSQVSGELLQIAKETLIGGISNASDMQIDRLVALHGDIVESDLIARLKTGLMGGDFELSRTDHINRLMFARTMKNQLTTILYVPAELMIYMAYDYNEYGIGKSILEDAKALAAMRAAVTVANVIGATKNAIPGKDINIELDPDDGDPVGTATFMANEALGLAYHNFPMGITSSVGLAEQLQLSAFSVNVTGNPRFPEVKTTITPRESVYAQVDQELQQQLRDDITRVFSLTPEMVDGANQPDFATTAVQNNLMLLKRVMVIQDKTNPMLTDYVRTFTYNSGVLVEQLSDLIEENAKFLPDEFKDDPEGFLEEYLNHLEVKLPEPNSDNLSKHIQMFKDFSDALDIALPAYLKEEYFDGYSPDFVRDALPTVIESWKGIILRDWMRKRGIFKELDVFSSGEDGSPLLNMADEMANHVDAVMKATQGYIKKVINDARKRKVKLLALGKDDTELHELISSLMTPEEPEIPEDDGLDDGEMTDENDLGLSDEEMGLGDEENPEDSPQEEEAEPTEEETPPVEVEAEPEEKDPKDTKPKDV